MKRTVILMLALLCAGVAFGQNATEKQKVAIYTEDKSGRNYAEFAGEFLTNSIVKRGTYAAYERTADFLKMLSKEQGYQRSGAVLDSDIAKLGAQLGVDLVCAVKIGLIDNQPFISARLINVETGNLQATARPNMFQFGDLAGFETSCENVTKSMFGERGSSRAVSGGSTTYPNTQRHPAEPEMVEVQGGTFWMGCTSEQQGSCSSDESPLHSVTLSSFKIAKYEVTQAQWQLLMGTSISQQQSKSEASSLYGVGDNYPMYYVSWNEVQEFISRLNAATGKNYRLPTEAEWEYAARGGNQSRGYKYAGSNFVEQVAWFTDNSGSTTHPVGTKQPNELGIYDMSGNVWEWCYDWYGSYSSAQQRDPIGASSGSSRVFRGGSWYYFPARCRVAFRNYDSPGYRDYFLGFRLVLP